jgi:hypothetical protein
VKTDVGVQPYKMVHPDPTSPTPDPLVTETLFYAVSSTSGRVVKYQVHHHPSNVVCIANATDTPENG